LILSQRFKITLSLFIWLAISSLFCQTIAEPPINFSDADAGSATNPYQISTLANLRWLSETVEVWGGYSYTYQSSEWGSYTISGNEPGVRKYFIQTDDIDATETRSWNNGLGFSPIGTEYRNENTWQYTYTVFPFQGCYDGNNHVISNLFLHNSILHPGIWYPQGLGIASMFGIVWNSTIKNVHLENTSPDLYIGNSADDLYIRVGRLVSLAYRSNFQNCSAYGLMNKSNGLLYAVYDNSLVEYCCSITDTDVLGAGLVTIAKNSIIRNSYTRGSDIYRPDSINIVEGLIGRAINSSISHVYIASKNETTNANLLSKVIDQSMIVNSRWDAQRTNTPPWVQGFEMIISSVIEDCLGLDTESMKDPSFYEGWDFVNIWGMHPDINDGFPYLRHDTICQSLGVEEKTIVTTKSSLLANYPNPFNPSTTILFDVARSGHVSLDIYNTKGQKVICLVDENKPAGSHIVHWNGVDSAGHSVASGIYFYRMTTDGYSSTKKMVLMK